MTNPRLLDDDLLDEFEAVLRARRIGIQRAWAHGLTDARIDEIIAPTDLQLPEEVRVWWRRHDGLVADDVPIDQVALVPGRQPMSLQDAVACHRERKEERQLLLIVNERPEIQLACRCRGDVPAPVYWDRYDDFARPEVAAPSLGELIVLWMSYIHRGVYSVGPDGGWAHDQPVLDDPPQDVRTRGLW